MDTRSTTTNTEAPFRPKVVIVGAGFGGLAAAKALEHAAVDITIVDRRNFHLFQPLLYQVATAALAPADIAWPIRSVFSTQENVEVLMMDVRAVNLAMNSISDGVSSVYFDYLIVATGATHSYFGHDEWKEFAPGLKTMSDATTLRDRLLSAFELAELAKTDKERRKHLTAVIIGGGATGVELAGALAELSRRTLRGEFRSIDPKEMQIVLVEAGPRLLPAFPSKLSERCLLSLEAMGVQVRLGTAVTDCALDEVSIGDLKIEASTIVWAAGVQASAAAQWLGAAHDRSNRVVVNPDLSVIGHSNVFAIGDTSHVESGGHITPGVASAAKQMGEYVACVIKAQTRHKRLPPPFVYKDLGSLAVIGRKSAIVSLGFLKFSGFLAWLFWCLVHILFLIGFRSKVAVALNWAWSFFTRERSARLISDAFLTSPAPVTAAPTRAEVKNKPALGHTNV